MSEVKTPSRRERAGQTRLRILHAAHEEFCAVGYHGATMAAIAKRAGVAVQTVYFVFHTKAELLTDTFDRAVLGEDATPPHLTPWFAAATTGRNLRASVTAFTTGNAAIQARVAKLHDVIRVAGLTDPEMERIWTHRENLRRDGYARFVQSIADREGLRPDLDVAAGTDVTLVLLGAATYLGLVDSAGWTEERYVAWLADTACSVLLAPSRRSRPR